MMWICLLVTALCFARSRDSNAQQGGKYIMGGSEGGRGGSDGGSYGGMEGGR